MNDVVSFFFSFAGYCYS